MTKRDLIEEVARHFPRFSRREAEVVVNTVFDEMTQTLARGERIELRGFGSFSIRQRRARKGRNPQTGEPVSVAANLAARLWSPFRSDYPSKIGSNTPRPNVKSHSAGPGRGDYLYGQIRGRE